MSFRRKIVSVEERVVPQDLPWIRQTTKVRMKKEIVIKVEPCNHTIYTTAGEFNGGKTIVCPWCESGEERQE
jgi:hypothetical protein